jgi:hypothetical protein
VKWPSKEEIRTWIEIERERIQREQRDLDVGQADQLTWEGWALSHLGLGRALFLAGEPLEKVRAAFREAARGAERIFVMAYDKSSPDYLGSRADPSTSVDVMAIDGFNAALMAGDLEAGRRLARWIPARSADPYQSQEVQDYTRSLQALLLEKHQEARVRVTRARQSLEHLLSKPLEEDEEEDERDWQRNYLTLALTLEGILKKSEGQFNEGLRKQAEFYEKRAHGEAEDTDEEYICDHLVALGNLGILQGLRLRGEIPYLPSGLLLKP